MSANQSPLVLITGGAGFIGALTGNCLIKAGYRVRVLDILLDLIHPTQCRPAHLHPAIELVVGDVCDAEVVRQVLDGVSYVYHFASLTATGQSMSQVQAYFHTNVTGTATLWQEIQRKGTQIKKVILASSRAVYGEGQYDCEQCGVIYPPSRTAVQLQARAWWVACPHCGQQVSATLTPEDAPMQPASVYGLTKRLQEETCQLMGMQLNIPIVILRYFNVYGAHQAASNPYTGVLIHFLSRLRRGEPAILFEEGFPQRDFIHVDDIVEANLAALTLTDQNPVVVLNVGSGQTVSLAEVAEKLAEQMGQVDAVRSTSHFRLGDIFCGLADLRNVKNTLGFQPSIFIDEGIFRLVTETATLV
ncbi:MAG: NAD-dependent epimerase/dehydratase family protein [Candidatus Promineifilaceae bacterium]